MTAQRPEPKRSARACSRIRLLQWLATAFLALMLTIAPAAPARASLLDCVEAAVPITQGLELGELGAEVAACAGLVTSDPVAAAVLATLVAMAAHGDIPPDTAQCNAAIDGIIAKYTAEGLLAIFGDKLTAGQKQLLTDVVNGAAGLSDITSSIPLFAALLQELHCGCTILGAPGAAAKIAGEYLENAQGCGQFFESIGEGILKVGEYLLCGATFGAVCPEDSCDGIPAMIPANGEARYWFCTAHMHDSDACWADCQAWYGDRNCRGVLCAAGQQCGGQNHDQCNACPWINKGYTDFQGHQKIKNVGAVRDNGSCGCSDNYQPEIRSTAGGDILLNCTCLPPYRDLGDGYCHCPEGQDMKNGTCTPCGGDEIYSQTYGQCTRCSTAGTKADSLHQKCVPACDASKGEYAAYKGGVLVYENLECRQCSAGSTLVYYNLNMLGGYGHCQPNCLPGQVFVPGIINLITHTKTPDSCFTCPANTRVVHDTADSSAGRCEACPDYTVSPAGSPVCTPLECGNAAYIDPDDTHACKSCPPGQIFIPTTLVPVSSATEIDKKVAKIPGHCGCPENTKQVGETCECPAGSLKAAESPFAPASVTCACPAGAHVDKASFSCKCATGATLDMAGTKCVCPPGARIEKDACMWPSMQVVPLVPKDCAALGPGFITNPKNRTACVRCPPGRIANDARTACVSPPVQRVVPPPRRGDIVRPVVRCPRDMRPNATGTACVPRYAPPPQFRTQRAIPPGFGRMPGPRPGMMMVPSMRRR